jgi:hypothetical protein
VIGLTQAAPFTITLSSPAPAAGVTVLLSSSDTSKVTITPASVSIGGGQTTPAAQPQVTGVNIGSATITAISNGFAPGSGAVQVNASVA